MLAAEILLALALLAGCGFAPGFFFIRYLRWSPMEKLCGSIAASYIILYLVFGVVYCLTPRGDMVGPGILALVSAFSIAMGLFSLRDMARLFGSLRVRRALAGFVVLLFWSLLLLSAIRVYSGASWMGDWLEHFQRSLFFLRHSPGTPILFGYKMPARPPAMNMIAALVLGQTRDRFEIFQVVFAWLNLLMFLPCCLIVPALAGARRTLVAPLVALFAMNPAVMESVTYTWTKAFTAFFVVLGFWFYLAGWRKNDPVRLTAGFVAVCMGGLVHYSAAPYLLFLSLHYALFVFWKRRGRVRELVGITAVCGLLLGSWFGWSIATYGARTTFGSNTSVISSQEYPGSNAIKIAGNVDDSIVPPILRPLDLLTLFNETGLNRQGRLGWLRDVAFVSYQTNAILSMGLVGGVVILWLLYRRLRFHRDPEGLFWLACIPFCVIVGIASTGERDLFGVAQATLLPMAVFGLSFLAAVFPLRRTLLGLVIAGCLIDFSLGIYLNVRVESVENTPQRTVFPRLRMEGGIESAGTTAESTRMAWYNWSMKHQYALHAEKLARLDEYEPQNTFQKADAEDELAQDGLMWHGWYQRHGGVVEYLGDHFGGESGRGTALLLWLIGAAPAGLAAGLLGRRGNRRNGL